MRTIKNDDFQSSKIKLLKGKGVLNTALQIKLDTRLQIRLDTGLWIILDTGLRIRLDTRLQIRLDTRLQIRQIQGYKLDRYKVTN